MLLDKKKKNVSNVQLSLKADLSAAVMAFHTLTFSLAGSLVQEHVLCFVKNGLMLMARGQEDKYVCILWKTVYFDKGNHTVRAPIISQYNTVTYIKTGGKNIGKRINTVNNSP